MLSLLRDPKLLFTGIWYKESFMGKGWKIWKGCNLINAQIEILIITFSITL